MSVCFVSGLLLLSKLQKPRISIFCFSTSLVLGYTLVSYYYLFVGLLNLYEEPFITFIPLMFASAAAWIYFRKATFLLKEILIYRKRLLLMIVLFGVLVLVRAFPDIGFDSNWFHLSQPLYYLRNGGIYHVGGYIFPSGYPQFTEMLFVPLLHWGDSITTSVFSLFNYFLLGLVIYSFVRLASKNAKYALLSSVIFFTTPIIFSYSNLAYVDVLQGLCLLLAFYWIRSFLSSENKRELFIAGLMLIPVASSKYTGGLLCVTLAGYVLFSSGRMKEKLKTVFVLAVIPALGLMPWLIRNKLEVGNFLDPIGEVKMLHYGSTSSNYIEYFKSINWFDTLKLLTSGEPLDYLVTFLVITSLIYFAKNKKWAYLVMIVLSLIVFRMMTPGDHYRYFSPFIPLIIALFFSSLSGVKGKFVSVILMATVMFFLFAQMFLLAKKVSPLVDYSLGKRNTLDFKSNFFVAEPFMFYDPTGRVKAEIGDQKLLVRGVDLIYPTLEDFDVLDYSFAEVDRGEVYSFGTLRSEMIENGYSYFLTNRGNLQSHFSVWFTENEVDKVDEYFDIVFHEANRFGNEWFLYKVRSNI